MNNRSSWSARFYVAGNAWELTTNSRAFLATAAQSFPEGVAPVAEEPRLWLDIAVTDVTGTGPWRSPKCRGRDHLVLSCVGEQSSLVYDYRRASVVGRVSQAVAADSNYWREIIFPFALGVMSPMLATVPLHAAGFIHHGRGVVVGGRSGAGKSTLSATLAKRGVTYVSDDWVYLTAKPHLLVHSLPVPLKLLPDSAMFFPELQSLTAAPAENGEISVPIDPADTFCARREFSCRPDVVILYDRVPGSSLRVRRASVKDLIDWFSESLDCVPSCLDARREEQLALIQRLQECACYVIVTDGPPETIAEDILRVCDGSVQADSASAGPDISGIEHLDLLRRGAPTNWVATVSIGGCPVRLATNDPGLLRHFETCHDVDQPWTLTVIVEQALWPGTESYAWRSGPVGLHCLGSAGAIACDFDHREAVAFVSAVGSEKDEFITALTSILERRELTAGVGR